MKKIILSLFLMIAIIFSIQVAAQAALSQTYYTVRFSNSYSVYTGPGTNYLRANGNARYGRGVARYYGTAPNGWVLMGYEASSGLWRMGYVEPSAAEAITTKASNFNLFYLNFTNTPAQITYNTLITDDPLYGDATPLIMLQAGQQVTVLDSWNSYWTYVEVQVAGYQPTRGFVKSDALTTSGTLLVTVPPTWGTPIVTFPPTLPPPITTGAPYLSALTNNVPSTGIMIPGSFSPTQPSYLLTVASWVSRVYFVPYCPTPGVTIYFNGQPVASGAQTPIMTLSNEPTFATITLVASDGKSNTYIIYIQRRPSERRTRVSAGFIESVYTNGSKNYIRADLVSVTYTAGTNLSSFVNETYYIYDYACSDNCIFYYGTIGNAIRASNFNEFVANYKNFGSTLYRLLYMEDEIVAVMPYANDYYNPAY